MNKFSFLMTSLGALLCGLSFAQDSSRNLSAAPGAHKAAAKADNDIQNTAAEPMKVYDISPARDGALLTVEDLFGRKVYPEAKAYVWNEEGRCVPAQGRVIFKNSDAPKAWSSRGSLYFKAGKDTLTIAESEADGIVYGETVSRNEFGIDGGVFPAPDWSKIAFYRKDERAVTQFPLLDIHTRTGSLVQARYPMNGMDSETISLGIWDRGSRSTIYVQCDDFEQDRYLTNISWSPDAKYVFIQVLDRSQHEMHLNQYRSSDGSFVRTILSERNDAWVEPLDPIHFLKDSWQFIYRTDNRDGYRSLYLCDTLGTVRRITDVAADVSYLSNDGKWLYYYSAEVSPVENHLFRVELKQKRSRKVADVKFGKPQRLTPERGWHDVRFSPDGCKFIDRWSSFNLGSAAAVRNADGSLVEELYRSEDGLNGFAKCEVEFGTVPSADGRFENWYRLYKPKDFDPAKKYPLIVYVYGGPHSQMVQDRWLGNVRMWEMLMAQKGYIVYVQDNRGTQNRGAEFEKAINRQCGQAEMADQMEGLRRLVSRGFVDTDRIGVHGWSYGGFMTISLMTNYPEVFKVGVAGGPVIDWKWYEIMYGERYMDTPETNPEGFEKTSLIGRAQDLKGKLLICQGAVDRTVLWEHSLNFAQKCVELNIPLDYFPYPMTEHNVMGSWRRHLYNKITTYFEDYL